MSFTGSLNNGWDAPQLSTNNGPNYEGEVVLNTKDKSLSLVVNGIWGPNLSGHSNSNLGAIDPIVTYKPAFLPGVTLESEYLYTSESGPVVNPRWGGFPSKQHISRKIPSGRTVGGPSVTVLLGDSAETCGQLLGESSPEPRESISER